MRTPQRRGRAGLAWGLVFFAALQGAFTPFAERYYPEMIDPEFGYKLSRLCRRRAEEPGRPLAVVLGSSHTLSGLRPDLLASSPKGGPAPLVFNFGLTGAGPVQELLCLRRLLDHGVRPDWLLVEVMPGFLNQEGLAAEEGRIDVRHLGWRDAPLLGRYFARRPLGNPDWWAARLNPCFTHRFAMLSRLAPEWLPDRRRVDQFRDGLDPWGWWPPRKEVSAEEYRSGLERARGEYAAVFDRFHVSGVADRALRELLELCRAERVRVLLFVMPEGSEFRGWHAPEAQAEADAYLAGLSAAYGVPLVNARCWVPDPEFGDGHHLRYSGATRFSERFAREAFRPLLEGQPAVTRRQSGHDA
jgi:hypothetical protein